MDYLVRLVRIYGEPGGKHCLGRGLQFACRFVCFMRRSGVRVLMLWCLVVFFFFQAEDGIRDSSVTGVQTCALPISAGEDRDEPAQADRTGIVVSIVPAHTAVAGRARLQVAGLRGAPELAKLIERRSGERRGGEKGRSPGAPDY